MCPKLQTSWRAFLCGTGTRARFSWALYFHCRCYQTGGPGALKSHGQVICALQFEHLIFPISRVAPASPPPPPFRSTSAISLKGTEGWQQLARRCTRTRQPLDHHCSGQAEGTLNQVPSKFVNNSYFGLCQHTVPETARLKKCTEALSV